MLFSTSIVAAAILSVASAQAVYPPFNASSIDPATRAAWCLQQQTSCNLLCLDQVSGPDSSNYCDSDDLSWGCICTDGKVPNATQYSQTIAYYECTWQVQACVANCGPSAPDCSEDCDTDMVCGASDPTRVNTTGTATVASSTSSSTATGTNAPDDSGVASGFGSTATDGSSPQQTGDDSSSVSGSKSAGNRLEQMQFGAYAFTAMILCVMCGAFSIHM